MTRRAVVACILRTGSQLAGGVSWCGHRVPPATAPGATYTFADAEHARHLTYPRTRIHVCEECKMASGSAYERERIPLHGQPLEDDEMEDRYPPGVTFDDVTTDTRGVPPAHIVPPNPRGFRFRCTAHGCGIRTHGVALRRLHEERSGHEMRERPATGWEDGNA